MEKPTYRTTSFVPRLGKREPKQSALDRLEIDRLLCTKYGLDCGRLLEELSRADTSGSKSNPLAALVESLAQATGGGSGEPNYGELRLLDLLAQQQQRMNSARESRGSSEELFDLVANKRVAFTPRIG